MNSGQLLYQGIRAFKNGQIEEARRLLEQVVALDEANETAWLSLSSVMEDSEQRRTCLENVLFLNPNNEIARERLALLPDRDERTISWLWRWLAKRTEPDDERYLRQLQPLKTADTQREKKGSRSNNRSQWQAFRGYFLLAGVISILLLTAILAAFI
jgi:tetratricopeptide (TPR) repeat protein